MNPPTGAEAPVYAAPGSPAAQCLVAANTKRERRPDEPAKISVKQLLVKYAGASGAGPGVTRTREAACMRAMEARDRIRGGTDVGDVIDEYSEEEGAATRGGRITSITRADVAPSFADAAFNLDVSRTSDVVETPYGFHVILRTE